MQNSLRILLSNIIDYAGLFPPAKLALSDAVANFAGYQTHDEAWMLNRFVLPIARLDEFADALTLSPDAANSEDDRRGATHLSVLGTGDLLTDIRRATEFNLEHGTSHARPRCVIDALEIKTDSLEQIAEVKRFKREEKGVTPDGDGARGRLLTQAAIEIYCETPLDRSLEELIRAIADSGAEAKIRTGGTTSDAIPSVEQVARFIKLCTDARVLFKATAGLHHPLRASHRLTYEPDSPEGLMHGFLNVFIAAAFAAEGANEDELCEILDARDISAFEFTDEAIAWRNRSIDLDRLRRARELSAVSFGSCSFTEPVADLRALDLL